MSSTDLCLYALCPVQPWRGRSGLGGRDPGSEGAGLAKSYPRQILLDLCIDVSPAAVGTPGATEFLAKVVPRVTISTQD